VFLNILPPAGKFEEIFPHQL